MEFDTSTAQLVIITFTILDYANGSIEDKWGNVHEVKILVASIF